MKHYLFVLLLLLGSIGMVKSQELSNPQPKEYFKWRFGIHSGVSHLTKATPDSYPQNLKSYEDDINSGWNFGIEGGYFFLDEIGIGIKYWLFYTSAQINDYVIYDTSFMPNTIILSNNITMHYIAPVFFLGKTLANNRIRVGADFSMGLLSCYNIGKGKVNFTQEGTGLGFSILTEADVFFTTSLSIGASVEYFQGKVNKFDFFFLRAFPHSIYSSLLSNISRYDLALALKWNIQ